MVCLGCTRDTSRRDGPPDVAQERIKCQLQVNLCERMALVLLLRLMVRLVVLSSTFPSPSPILPSHEGRQVGSSVVGEDFSKFETDDVTRWH